MGQNIHFLSVLLYRELLNTEQIHSSRVEWGSASVPCGCRGCSLWDWSSSKPVLVTLEGNGSRSVVPGPSAPASPGNMLQRCCLRPSPDDPAGDSGSGWCSRTTALTLCCSKCGLWSNGSPWTLIRITGPRGVGIRTCTLTRHPGDPDAY